jgi:hypothetical protein
MYVGVTIIWAPPPSSTSDPRNPAQFDLTQLSRKHETQSEHRLFDSWSTRPAVFVGGWSPPARLCLIWASLHPSNTATWSPADFRGVRRTGPTSNVIRHGRPEQSHSVCRDQHSYHVIVLPRLLHWLEIEPLAHLVKQAALPLPNLKRAEKARMGSEECTRR